MALHSHLDPAFAAYTTMLNSKEHPPAQYAYGDMGESPIAQQQAQGTGVVLKEQNA